MNAIVSIAAIAFAMASGAMACEQQTLPTATRSVPAVQSMEFSLVAVDPPPDSGVGSVVLALFIFPFFLAFQKLRARRNRLVLLVLPRA